MLQVLFHILHSKVQICKTSIYKEKIILTLVPTIIVLLFYLILLQVAVLQEWKFSTLKAQIVSVGIADNSLRFGKNEKPEKYGFKNICIYDSQGDIHHIGEWIQENSEVPNGHRIQLELNMNAKPHTLTFFIDEMQQKNYVTKIPSTVRFWVNFYESGAQFRILRFEKIQNSTALFGRSTRNLEWGQEWKD
ncbi:MAG: hypothetical protein EZS28_038208 [Streblomastix strix]|uniref:Uncharacterized protein n=1 Tax=Streblomastix strix TaxID=222440 RepID=A0A5J4U992_9EUKA|nr:MAG: hypothetical protein EZS28_038208 [Streblomastix strix]